MRFSFAFFLRNDERNGDFSPINWIVFVELLQCSFLAAQHYLPRPEYQAEDHQWDFRNHIQSDRRGNRLLPSIHPNLIQR